MQPCDWPIADIDCPAYEDLSDDLREYVEAMAVEYLWRWTGMQYGLCEVALRPCKQPCFEGTGTFYGGRAPFQPYIHNGEWYNLGCGTCGDKCGCDSTRALLLPGPVESIVEVMIDGEVLPDTSYRVDNRRRLVRLDGSEWPTCQQMDRPMTDTDTWQVTYMRGTPVPIGGQVAAAILACEFASSMTDGECRLPQRVTNLTRQDVSMTFLDGFDDLKEGHTGIWEIDSWVASVMHTPRPSTVSSPDYSMSKGRVTTWQR